MQNTNKKYLKSQFKNMCSVFTIFGITTKHAGLCWLCLLNKSLCNAIPTSVYSFVIHIIKDYFSASTNAGRSFDKSIFLNIPGSLFFAILSLCIFWHTVIMVFWFELINLLKCIINFEFGRNQRAFANRKGFLWCFWITFLEIVFCYAYCRTWLHKSCIMSLDI